MSCRSGGWSGRRRPVLPGLAPPAGLPALLPAGRLRAAPVPALGQRPLADRSGVLAVDRLRVWLVPYAAARDRRSRSSPARCSSAPAQPDPRRSGKIPLKLTWRATRVLRCRAVLALDGVAAADPCVAPQPGFQAPLVASAMVFAALPLLLIAANALLGAVRAPRAAAATRPTPSHASPTSDPFIVGITGSYGKSSTKSMLAHILQFDAPTLAASGSINTLMGVTRHIREELVFGHEFMVVEMGAFKTGSIRRLCQLTPPSAGAHHRGRRHASRAVRIARRDRARQERAGAGASRRRTAGRQRRQPRRAADRAGARPIAACCSTAKRRPRISTRASSRVQFSKQGTSFVLRTTDARVHAASRRCWAGRSS